MVAASHRRQGVGRALLDAAVALGDAGRACASSSCTSSRGTSRRSASTRAMGSSAKASAAGTTSVTARWSTRSSWRITSLRQRNPLHLQRPDQEPPHLGLVARVEERLSADHPARGSHGLDELGDRRARLRPTDGERDPACAASCPPPARHRATRRHPCPRRRCDAPAAARRPSARSPARNRCARPCLQRARGGVPCPCRLRAGCVPHARPPPPARRTHRRWRAQAQPTASPRAPPRSEVPRPGAGRPRRAAPRRGRRGSRSASGRARSKTRGRWSRSASQHAPIVASSETWPVGVEPAAPRRGGRSGRRRARARPRRAARARTPRRGRPCPGSTASFSRRVSCRRPKQKTSPRSAPGAASSSASPVAATQRQCVLAVPGASPAATRAAAPPRRGSSATALPRLDHRTLRRGLR